MPIRLMNLPVFAYIMFSSFFSFTVPCRVFFRTFTFFVWPCGWHMSSFLYMLFVVRFRYTPITVFVPCSIEIKAFESNLLNYY